MSYKTPIIEFLPSFVSAYEEISQIMNTEQIEFDNLWTGFERTLDNGFIQSADIHGVEKFEKMLGITPLPIYSLDERKFNILSKFNEELPYTYRKMCEILGALCGKDGYKIEADYSNYKITIKVELTAKNKVGIVADTVRRIIPANLISEVILLYNQHELLHLFIHQELSEWTHDELRKEVTNNDADT